MKPYMELEARPRGRGGSGSGRKHGMDDLAEQHFPLEQWKEL